MHFLYSSFMYLLTPWLLLRLWWKGRTLPAYKNRIPERFSLNKPPPHQKIDVWVHAVSLGEVIAATPLINALLNLKYSILVTTMTPTGYEKVKASFGEKLLHQYIPYDLPLAMKRFYQRFNPRVGVIMETELWPNLIREAHQAKVPLLLANARLSQISLKGYLKLRSFFKPLLNQFTGILAQSKDDAERFITLGAKKSLVQVLGNIKFDLNTQLTDNKQFLQLKTQWGSERIAFIAASTHDDEESQILAEFRRLQQAIPQVILLIAPRHPERFQKVYQLCNQKGFKTGLRSNQESFSFETEVLVLDSLGELLSFYQISDYAFVGGSLVPIGGHNVLEPIAMKVPVFSGHYVHNFKTICADLQKVHAIKIVNNASELIDAVIQLHKDKEQLNQMVKTATQVLESNKGSLSKHMEKISDLYQKSL